MSTDTICGRWPFFVSQRASLPVEVVLPEPCNPTIRKTLGGSLANLSFDSWLPRTLISSSLMIPITCCEGDSELSTSCPIARVLPLSMRCLTTLKLTSASSSATRTSRRAVSIFSAVRRPSPRRFLKTRCSLSDRLSNILIDRAVSPREGDFLVNCTRCDAIGAKTLQDQQHRTAKTLASAGGLAIGPNFRRSDFGRSGQRRRIIDCYDHGDARLRSSLQGYENAELRVYGADMRCGGKSN